jgi:FKBP-type peptidyl-prolyl cis-trans isomerase 2
VRRTPLVRAAAVAAVALAVAGGLSACNGSSSSSGPSASPSPSASTDHKADVAAVDKITVTGDAGAEPKVTLPSKPFVVTTNVVRTLSDGTGAALTKGQLATVHQVVIAGADGSTAQTTYGDSPDTLTVGTASGITEFDQAIAKAHVGSRILVATAQGDATYVYVFEITGARDIPARASGTPVTPEAGLPAVTLGADGKPSIAKPTGAAPADLKIQPLIKGTGPAVQAGQTVIVKYTGWLWDGTQFDSSWDRGDTFAFQVGAGQVISGWDKGVTGQTVGSQVLLVVPPAEGYKDQAQGSIPANSTLIFVVDILAVQ